MTVSSTGSVTGASASSNISLQDFLQVLMTQLTYQDPLKPMDNTEFLAQIAQFTALEQTQEMNTNIQSLLVSQSAQQAVGLIGHTVSVTTSNGPMSGQVASIDLSSGTPIFSLTTSSGTISSIAFSQITSIK